MMLKQRRTPLDPVLLRVVLPLLYEAHLTPLTGFTRMWHRTPRQPRRSLQQHPEAEPASLLPEAA